MQRVLGFDLGVRSIGWALREGQSFIDAGVMVFTPGIGEEKGVEFSLAAQRTEARNKRKQYDRRRRRKLKLLSVLCANGMTPATSRDIADWRKSKKPILTSEFMQWVSVDPYKARNEAARGKVDPLVAGRALYHLCQRRGFLSNRKTQDDDDSGKVKDAIKELASELDGKTYGQYFHDINPQVDRIRARYTDRKAYWSEFDKIAHAQQWPDNLKQSLYDAIYFQRPLKSQKGKVAACRFEKNKRRSLRSHPQIEMYTALSFLANVKVQLGDSIYRLNGEERQALLPIFYETKSSFKFKKIAQAIRKLDRFDKSATFNYKEDLVIKNSLTCYSLKQFFGDEWQSWSICNLSYVDIWHAWMDFDQDELLSQWAIDKLKMDEENAAAFAKVRLKSDTSNLSIKAAKKINYFLLKGFSLSESIFLAQFPSIVGESEWVKGEAEYLSALRESFQKVYAQNDIVDTVNGLITRYRREYDANSHSPEEFVELPEYIAYAADRYHLKDEARTSFESEVADLFMERAAIRGGKARLAKVVLKKELEALLLEWGGGKEDSKKLYHPSSTDIYPAFEHELGSPINSALKNPAVMRMMHMLRKLVNTLIKKGKIDKETRVVFEATSEVNTKNRRAAIERWQRERAKDNERIRARISEYFKGRVPAASMPTLITRYRLWEEQNEKCMYTLSSDDTIRISEVLQGKKYEIEHTIPRSKSYDNSLVNLTLASAVANQAKGNRIPFDLSPDVYDNLMRKVEAIFEPKLTQAEKRYWAAYNASRKDFATKEAKDRAIQNMHYRKIDFNYWKSKVGRFKWKEVSDDFKPSMLTDTQVIVRYTTAYLNAYFDHPVIGYKSAIVDEVAKAWGIKTEGEKKDRSEHFHHAIDAALVSTMYYRFPDGRTTYDELRHYYQECERYDNGYGTNKPSVPKPWPTVVEDTLDLKDRILVYSHYKDNLFKNTKIKERRRGEIVKTESGEPIYKRGGGVRANLHKETYYRGIAGQDGPVYLTTVNVSDLKKATVSKIVDKAVRELVDAQDLNSLTERGVLYRPVKRIKCKNGKRKLIKDFDNVASFKTEVSDDNFWKRTILDQLAADDTLSLQTIAVSQPIKKVKIKASDVKSPVQVRVNPFGSKSEWRREVNAKNDGNYCMGIYSGQNDKGKTKNTFINISVLEAIRLKKEFGDQKLLPDSLVKKFGKKEIKLRLKYIVKPGMSLLLLENGPDEIDWDNLSGLQRRHYVVRGLTFKSDSIGVVKCSVGSHAKYTEHKWKDGVYKVDDYVVSRKMTSNNLKALIQGVDFEIDADGEIRKIE